MRSDIFTKHCDDPTFERHTKQFAGQDECMADAHGTHKGRVLEINYCEYHEGTYMTSNICQLSDEYGSVMSTLFSLLRWRQKRGPAGDTLLSSGYITVSLEPRCRGHKIMCCSMASNTHSTFIRMGMVTKGASYFAK
eukprot:11912135-Ditylum_brightwellii.AAC.1